ncbi:unnamed protein product [Lupinus luteus]|uniref:Uncharacterized protein n=1 Tax=Lupinus luteus TaxID=3873 RepID=A0AAV1Y6U7_LUPLU
MISDYVDSNGDWNASLLADLVPNDILVKILALPPSTSAIVDSVIWLGSSNGPLSVNSAYNIISNHDIIDHPSWAKKSENKSSDVVGINREILARSASIREALRQKLDSARPDFPIIWWFPPDNGWVKRNSDGAFTLSR